MSIRLDERFTFRLDATERALIKAVAGRLERDESDTLRFVLREKARALGVPIPGEATTKAGKEMRDGDRSVVER